MNIKEFIVYLQTLPQDAKIEIHCLQRCEDTEMEIDEKDLDFEESENKLMIFA